MKTIAKTLSAAVLFAAQATSAPAEGLPPPGGAPHGFAPPGSCEAIVAAHSGDHPPPQELPGETVTITTKGGLTYTFNVQNADTPAEQEMGLMYRDGMAADEGMIFTDMPGGESRFGVWMENTYMPLDLVFIGKDGTIQYVYKNAQPCDETVIRPPSPAGALLELKAGTLDALGIRPGDVVHAKFFNNMPKP
jgi:uncharacterized membrane protein (UPF0127 family)